MLDGLEDERQQKITIAVAYRFFETTEQAFAVADTLAIAAAWYEKAAARGHAEAVARLDGLREVHAG